MKGWVYDKTGYLCRGCLKQVRLTPPRGKTRVLDHITLSLASSLHSRYRFKTDAASLSMWTSDGVMSALLYNSVLSLLLGRLTKLVCVSSVLQKCTGSSQGVMGRAGSGTVLSQIFLCQMTLNMCWTGQDLEGRRGKAVFGLFDVPRKPVLESCHYFLWRHVSDTDLQY